MGLAKIIAVLSREVSPRRDGGCALLSSSDESS
jgi:hypothetical protein